MAAKIKKALIESFCVNDVEMHTSASIGISLYPVDGRDVDALVARADEAMYFAKQCGRNSYQFFNHEMSVFSQERLDLENDLRRALALKQTERALPAEERRRHRAHPQRRGAAALAPSRRAAWSGRRDSSRLAEECGMILQIGEWVLREACRQAGEWRRKACRLFVWPSMCRPLQFRQSNFFQADASGASRFRSRAAKPRDRTDRNHSDGQCRRIDRRFSSN